MKTKPNDNVLLFSVILLLSIAKSSHQTVYPCNAKASCGCSSKPVSISRIVGGENAPSATWSWAVSLSIADTYLCGGSILSSSWVITAAHCVTGIKASQITIYAGSTQQFSGTQTRVASRLIVHPNYNPTTYVNDIALLQLASPLNMSDPYVGTICVPSVSSSILAAGEWPAVATTVVAVGWGTLSEDGSLPSTLQQVTVQTVARNADTCNSSLADWHVQLCAGASGGGKDTCQGDSGGPLMMFIPSQQWVLVGLTSNGIGCAEAAYSGIYTRVAAFQDWIKVNTGGSVTPLTSSVTTTVSTTARTTSPTVVSTKPRTTSSTAVSTTPRTASSTTVSTTPRTASSTVVSTTPRTASSTAVSTTARTASSTAVSTTPHTASSTVVSTTPRTASSTAVSTTARTASSTAVSTTPRTASSTAVSTKPRTASSTAVSTTPRTATSTAVFTTVGRTVITTPSDIISSHGSTVTISIFTMVIFAPIHLMMNFFFRRTLF